ncbi:unnamed protein product [Darwinula stevensoni]|uniref:adenylate cyclase n=1 Tax=Darwinula stevensoni TaxID=69355 RepID=A0A7R8X658_9CRUS|nr:unnamed protein product [Darwinula stevensoni]CAG0886554.1 unnamed protein product [Darwinula stevensoni]
MREYEEKTEVRRNRSYHPHQVSVSLRSVSHDDDVETPAFEHHPGGDGGGTEEEPARGRGREQTRQGILHRPHPPESLREAVSSIIPAAMVEELRKSDALRHQRLSALFLMRKKWGGIDVDMRIGIHSGSVYSCILGLSKLQFDIWSTDAKIANHMEQAGRPG